MGSNTHQELMSLPKEGRSVQLRGTAFEFERLRHFPYMDLFSSGVKCSAKALSRIHIVTCVYSTGDKRVTRGYQFTTMKQKKENVGLKGSESGKPWI